MFETLPLLDILIPVFGGFAHQLMRTFTSMTNEVFRVCLLANRWWSVDIDDGRLHTNHRKKHPTASGKLKHFALYIRQKVVMWQHVEKWILLVQFLHLTRVFSSLRSKVPNYFALFFWKNYSKSQTKYYLGNIILQLSFPRTLLPTTPHYWRGGVPFIQPLSGRTTCLPLPKNSIFQRENFIVKETNIFRLAFFRCDSFLIYTAGFYDRMETLWE